MNPYLDQKNQNLLQVAEEHAEAYKTAAPFPNIAFRDFFDPAYLDAVLEEFPDLSKKDATRYENAKHIKFEGKGEDFFGVETKKLMYFLNSQPFLEFLQVLTGIKEPLISDPYFVGAGQHEIKRGGLLKIHADFNKHTKLHLDRRINVLVYLNKDWHEEYGGHLELWDSDMKSCQKQILPMFNTLAIFSTTDFSYHGHPNALTCPEDRSRKSLALYYYSNGRPKHEVIRGQENHSTLFKVRSGSDEDAEALKESLLKKSLRAGKVLAKDLTPPILFRAMKSLANKE